jgi:hypothetical protein
MKGLSLKQPWATLVAIGAKQVETRAWQTTYRGDLVICSSAKFDKADARLCVEPPLSDVLAAYGVNVQALASFPTGQALAVVTLERCCPVGDVAPVLSEQELACGDYSAGRWAWMLRYARRIRPIPAKGALGVWRLPVALEEAVRGELAARVG